MVELERYTIDASVLLKLVVEEEYTTHSIKLASDFGEGKIILNAPAIIDYEVGSALSKMVKKKIIKLEYAQEALHRLLKVPISRVVPGDLTAALEISNRLGIHYYDTLYLIVAKETKSSIISVDAEMINAAKKFLHSEKGVIHLKDY